MKYLLSAIIITVLAGCQLIGIDVVKGSGNMITESRSIGDFTAVEAGGPVNVEITPGNDYSVVVDADDNLMQYIITRKENNKLVIKLENNVHIRGSNDILVKVKMPRITGAGVSGSGNVKTTGTFSGNDKLETSVSGSGNLEMDIHCPKISSSIAGSGKITLMGETRDLEVHISGSGDYYGEDLKCENANVSVSGSGNAKVYASVSLEVRVSGSGNVVYKGSPKISQHVAGSGSVRSAD